MTRILSLTACYTGLNALCLPMGLACTPEGCSDAIGLPVGGSTVFCADMTPVVATQVKSSGDR